MEAHDRLVLGLAVLEGDRDARKILADLLEEQGERGLAQWARTSSGQRVRRLHLVLMLLPCRPAIRLGTNFFEQTLTHFTKTATQDALHITLQLHEWVHGRWSNADIVRLRLALPEQLLGDPNWNQWTRLDAASKLLVAAVQNAVRAEDGDNISAASRLHWEMQANHQIRKVADWCRTDGLPYKSLLKIKKEAQTTIDWQIAHSQAVIHHLLHPQETPWPK